MDEIDWLKGAKKAFMLYAKVFVGITILLGGNVWFLLINMGFIAILGICYLILIIVVKISNTKVSIVKRKKNS